MTSIPPASFTVDFEDPFDLAGPAVREVVEKAGCTAAPRRSVVDRGEDIVDRADVLSGEELDDPRGRQLLHVTRGSILGDGALRVRLSAALTAHADLYTSLATVCLERHLSLLHAAT